jgi:hypothetical protein
MKSSARITLLGLMVLAVGCGDNSPQPSAEPPPPAPEISPVEAMAPAGASDPVTAVPVRYVVDPSTTTQLSVSSGVELDAPGPSSPAPGTPGAMRRTLK